MGWKFFDTGKRTAAENMKIDASLLADLEKEREPMVHLYDWETDAATYGYFINPDKFFQNCAENKLSLAKRPTGGGIVFHNCDLAFSILMPASCAAFSPRVLDNYAYVNSRVLSAVSQMIDSSAKLLPDERAPIDEDSRSFCMAKPTKYDVMIQGKKVCGAALRKTRHGYLYQGSILLGFLPEVYLRDVLVSNSQVIENIRSNSFALLGENWTIKELEEGRDHLRSLLKHVFTE